MQRITVITADVIESKNAGDYKRSLTQKLSELRHPMLLSRFSLSRGDEIQGVLSGWLRAPELIRQLRFACRPLKLRVGIGVGANAGPVDADPWSMDGPAFHLARSALDNEKRNKKPSTCIRTGSAQLDDILYCIWLLIDSRQNRWTDKQWEAVQAYERYRTYEEASKNLHIRLQNVQKRCHAADWHQLKLAEKTLSKLELYADRFNLA
ncbi:MAG: SatD family protein [Bacillota bacterium]